MSIPAPIGGWNTRDALVGLPPEDALCLDNFFPDVSSVRLREGYTEHQTITGDVETLAEYHSGNIRKLIACSNSNVYDATSTPSSLASGFTSDVWQTVMFKSRLFMVNGNDAPRDFDGTTLNSTTWTGTGLTISNLVDVTAHKSRLYFIEDATMSFWYATAGAVTGTLTEFDLSTIAKWGGTLLTARSWTHDGGDGPDDYIAFLTDKGEVIVYQGDDPSTAADWLLVGQYKIGEPVNRRSVLKTGGDLLIATKTDYVYMSTVLRTGQLGQSSKLSGALKTASINSGLDGWQLVLDTTRNVILSNVPNADGTFDQHVVNAVTGAACRFKDMGARCWAVYDSDLYFGVTGAINKFGGDDDNGTDIEAVAEQAWIDTGIRQRVSAVRPVFTYSGSVDYGFSVGYDYLERPNLQYTASLELAGAEWDTATWDVSAWGGSATSVAWRAARGTGQSFSPMLAVRASVGLSWNRTDLRMESGRHL